MRTIRVMSREEIDRLLVLSVCQGEGNLSFDENEERRALGLEWEKHPTQGELADNVLVLLKIGAIDNAAVLPVPAKQPGWCDNDCGQGGDLMVAELPCDVASAKKGESALLCQACHDKIMPKTGVPLNFHEWKEQNTQDLDCEWGESGKADEPDSDWERFLEDRYDDYMGRERGDLS